MSGLACSGAMKKTYCHGGKKFQENNCQDCITENVKLYFSISEKEPRLALLPFAFVGK
jgi:hypothetical protein